jgi:hypothetical protein
MKWYELILILKIFFAPSSAKMSREGQYFNLIHDCLEAFLLTKWSGAKYLWENKVFIAVEQYYI